MVSNRCFNKLNNKPCPIPNVRFIQIALWESQFYGISAVFRNNTRCSETSTVLSEYLFVTVVVNLQIKWLHTMPEVLWYFWIKLDSLAILSHTERLTMFTVDSPRFANLI